MSNEFHEWNPSLERQEVKDTPQDHKVEISTEAMEWARRILEGISPREYPEEVGEAKESTPFQEFPPVKLMDGLTLERIGRHQEHNEQLEKLKPSDYTTKPYSDSNGLRHHGQVDLEKLTPAALENISGTPEQDIPLWTLQSENNSCAVNCSSFILRSEVDPRLTEGKLIQEGREQNLYFPDIGTYFKDVGALCEAHGMEREMLTNVTLEDIEHIQDGGGKVIAMVSALRMAFPNRFGFFRADHAVQVVGIDRNDPEDVRVILNDPGRQDGQGLSVPEKVFLKAWATSGYSLAALYTRR